MTCLQRGLWKKEAPTPPGKYGSGLSVFVNAANIAANMSGPVPVARAFAPYNAPCTRPVPSAIRMRVRPPDCKTPPFRIALKLCPTSPG